MDKIGYVLASAVYIVLLCAIAEANDETRLVDDLFRDYNKLARPVQNGSDPINVKIGFSLVQILGFDQSIQVINIAGWLKLFWKDHHLTWDPAAYGNIKSISVPVEMIWSPDIVLYNAVENVESVITVPVHVEHNGDLAYITVDKYAASCATAPEEDKPSCELKYGSWTRDASQIDLITMADIIEADYYLPNHDWELSTTKSEKHVKEYDCCPDTKYTNVGFTFNLVRREEEQDQDMSHLNTASNLNVNFMFVLMSTILLIVKLL